MNLHQNALGCKTNIQNNLLILRILEGNIFWSAVERDFSYLCKLKVKPIFFFDSIGRRLNTLIIYENILVFYYNLVITINYCFSTNIEKSKIKNLFFFINNKNLQFFLNKLVTVLSNLMLRFQKSLQSLTVFEVLIIRDETI